MTTDLMKNCLQQCFCRSNVKRKIKHLQNIMTSMLHNLQIKRSFLLQFSFFFEGKIYIQLLNIDKSFAASAFLKKIIGLISYLENNYLLYNIVFVYQIFLCHRAEFLIGPFNTMLTYMKIHTVCAHPYSTGFCEHLPKTKNLKEYF